ncbi:MAG TPA: GntR family transcriptional regulator [Gemmatimonadales bacterium]|nr:GntR family transcriptional regulator [Gemmatimonadales bacterium]
MQLEQVLAGMPRLQKQATHEMVAAVLREAISTGVLRANQPLPQDEIASRLSVSHIPVREALRQLQSEGLVTYQPNRGAAVSALTPAEIREIYDIRVLLESAAVRRATPHLGAHELDRARAILDEAEVVQDGARWGALDVEFHQLVYHLQDRPRLGEMIAGLLRRVDRYWLSHGLMLTHRREFETEHRELLAAVQRRDPNGAAALLERHLTGAAEFLVTELEAEARAQEAQSKAMAG